MSLRSLLGAVGALALGVLPLHAQTDLWIAPSGVWTNASNWSNGVPANNGTVVVSFGTSPPVPFSSTVDANFSINSLTVTAQAGPFTLQNSNASVLTIGSALVDQSNQSVALAVPLAGSMTLQATGTGALTIGGTQNTFTGATEIESGSYADANANAFSTGSVLEVASGATVTVNHNETAAGLTNFGNAGGSVVLGSGATLTLGGNGLSPFGGVLSGAGALTLNNLETTLSGANTYSGGTTLTRGLLIANNPAIQGGVSSATGTGNITIMPGAILELGVASAAGAVSAPSIVDNGSVAFSRTDASTLASAISGTGTVTQIGSGNMTLSGTNTYSGTTTVSFGTLTAGSTSAFGGTSLSPVVISAGTLNLNGFANRIGTLGGTSKGTLNLTNALLTLGKAGGASDFAGLIEGSGALALDGSGQTTTLGGTNTFTGGVTVDAGSLFLGNAAGAGTGTITLKNGSVLSAAGTGTSLTVNNPVAGMSGTVQLGANDDNALTLNGGLSGAAGVDYAGGSTGSLILGAPSPNLAGSFTLSSGTVIAGANTAFGPLGNTVTLVNGSTLGVAGGQTVANPILFTGPGASTLTGSGTFSFPLAANALVDIAAGRPTGTLTFSGGLTFSTGSALTLHMVDAAGNPGVGYGQLNATGGLSFEANPGTLAFNLVSVNASGASANAANFNPSTPFSWTFATSSTPIGTNVLSQFSLNTSGFTNATNGGTFSLSEAGNGLSLSLNFTPVPEPSTYALLVAGLLGLGPWAYLRRSRKAKRP